MKFPLAALLLVVGSFIATPVSAQDNAFRASMVAAVAAHGADLATTEYCIGRGVCHETNPFLFRFSTQPAVFGVVKMGIAAGALWGVAKLHDSNPRLAQIINWGTTAFFTGVAIHNTRQTSGK